MNDCCTRETHLWTKDEPMATWFVSYSGPRPHTMYVDEDLRCTKCGTVETWKRPYFFPERKGSKVTELPE